MKKPLRAQAVLLVLVSALGLSQLNCGLILHPDRNGRRGSRVDVVAIVLDCLWLIPGIVPGVVALLIDFVTGGIYEASLHHLRPGDPVGLRFNGPAPRAADMDITLTAPDGKVHSLASRHVDQGHEMDQTPLHLPDTLAPGRYGISIAINGRENAHFSVEVR